MAETENISDLAKAFSDTLTGYQNQVKEQLQEMPPSFYLPIYGSLLYVMVLVLSRGGGIFNIVKVHPAANPIRFNPTGKSSVSVTELINSKIPELRNHAVSFFNPFLFTGHLQTMFAGIRKFRRSDRLYFGRQIIRTEDGGSVSLDEVIGYDQYRKVKVTDKDDVPEGQNENINDTTRYLTKEEIENQGSQDNKPMIIALHGLSGSSAESYCRCLFSRLHEKQGFDCFVLNARGCGNTELTSPALFCAMWTEDIRQTVKLLKSRFPNRPLFAVGFSLGSAILTNYLGQEGDHSGIDFAVTLACIWDLRASGYQLENGLISGTFYGPIMALPLLRLLSKHRDELRKDPIFAQNYTPETVRKVRQLSDFDDNFTSPMFGFTCADQYYFYGSPIQRMDNIRTPLLNINSLDDPIAGTPERGCIPLTRASFNPYITMITTTLGGHLGWFKWNNVRWYADPVSDLMGELYRNVFKDGFKVEVEKGSIPKPVCIEDGRLVRRR
ncbi:DEKNAAC100990 [Brettanomyces naardenensis]|uniref:DEKNAAC100990 n=1 Tax=Brettanomyces naardenensis TaxID=13370 RepID=A0A448YH53_BRENA|nr:DEKNAAC100990 [Brettanomyces naardenensis]